MSAHSPDLVTGKPAIGQVAANPEPVLTDAGDGAPERLHLQPVRRLLQSIGPGGGEGPVALAPFIATRPAGAGGAGSGTDIAGFPQLHQKRLLPAGRGAIRLAVAWHACRICEWSDLQCIIGNILFCVICQADFCSGPVIPPPQAPQAPVDGHDLRLSGFADDDDTGQPIARHRRVPTIIVAVAVAVSIAATPTCQDHRLRRVKAAPSKRFASPLSRNGSRESYPARRCARRQGGHRPFAVAGPAYQRPAQDAPPSPACFALSPPTARRGHWPCPCDWPCRD